MLEKIFLSDPHGWGNPAVTVPFTLQTVLFINLLHGSFKFYFSDGAFFSLSLARQVTSLLLGH